MVQNYTDSRRQVGCDPDQLPSERQVRVDDPESVYPL